MRHPMLPAFLLAACAALPALATAQDTRMTSPHGDLPFPGELTRGVFVDADYLSPVLEMERHRDEYRRSAQWGDTFAQLLAMQYSFAGEDSAALATDDQRGDPRADAPAATSALDGARARDAARVIAEAARTHRAVFVNEAHHVARHRAFTLSLLQALYREGYRYFAVEAVTERDTALNARGHALFRKSGLYVNEPEFGELIRAALRIGYRVVPYDVTVAVPPRPGDPAWALNERERIQAQNLYDRTLARDPGAKILVHAGYDHIRKLPVEGVTLMAAQFRRISGIDPFTVDQVGMMEHSSPRYESPVYRAAADGGRLHGSTIFVRPDGTPFTTDPGFDAQVFHPRETRVDGRPGWLREAGARRPYAVRGVPPEAPVLVQAFVASEGVEGVPADQVVLRGPAPAPAVLVLAPGRYLLRVLAPGRRVLKEEVVEAGSEGTLTLH